MSCAQIWLSDLNQISSESKQQPPLAQRTTRTLIIFSKRTGLFTRYFAKLCGIFFVTAQEINMQMLGVLADIRIHIKDKWCERQQMRQEKTELCKEDCDVYTSFYVSNPPHVYTVTIYYYYLESGSSRVFFPLIITVTPLACSLEDWTYSLSHFVMMPIAECAIQTKHQYL